ncbi:MAG: hypothetical protein L0L50_05550, partial [Propionibacterium sp.]|nr:hypothetical protein [Propionibacterium sp.]
ATRDPTTPFAAGDSLFPTSTGHDDPHRPIRLDAALAPGGANNPPDPSTMVAAPHDAPPPNPAARFDSSHVAGGTAGAQPTGHPGQAQAPQGQFRPGQFPPPGF